VVEICGLIPGDAKFIAGEILEARTKKKVKNHLSKAISEIDNFDSDVIIPELISKVNSEVRLAGKDGNAKGVVARFNKSVAAAKNGSGYGIRSSFTVMDQKYVRYQPGHIWVVGAWTSTGKTASMIEAIKRLHWVKDAKVAVISTEMTEDQLVARYIANLTGVSSHKILSGRVSGQVGEQVDHEVNELSEKNFYIKDDIIKMDQIETFCKKLSMKHGLDVVFIDFIQNLRRTGANNKYEMMSDIAIDIQQLAKTCKCTIVCLSQIPNSAAKEDNGILEFKNAGEIAAAADLGVIMKRSKTDNETILFDVKKNRHGPLFHFGLKYENNFTRLDEAML
jgi:replicative DNA helicase